MVKQEGDGSVPGGSLPDLKDLSPEERAEALRMMEIARRAEERAAARMAARAAARSEAAPPTRSDSGRGGGRGGGGVVRFVSKEERARREAAEAEAAKRAERERLTAVEAEREAFRRQAAADDRKRREAERAEREAKWRSERERREREREEREASRRGRGGARGSGAGARQSAAADGRAAEAARSATEGAAADAGTGLSKLELEAIRKQYGGGEERRKRRKLVKPSERFGRTFVFDWAADEDTSEVANPLYARPADVSLGFGKGRRAGVHAQELQRERDGYLERLESLRRRVDAEDSEMSRQAMESARREREAAMAAIRGAQRKVASRAERRMVEREGKHWSEKTLEEMTERDWRIVREDFSIHVRGRPVPPMRSWEECRLKPATLRAIKEKGYEQPTPIQRQAIPCGLMRRDLIGIAETGSGKTAAFLVPLIEYVQEQSEEVREKTKTHGPLAIIMVPVRELANQITAEIDSLGRHAGVRYVCMVGGRSIADQAAMIARGCDVVIGTPGRLLEALDRTHLVLNLCSWIILDEADVMVDMGFEHSVTTVLKTMGGALKSTDADKAEEEANLAAEGKSLVRVTSMFSATMPAAVERMAKVYLRHPCIIRVGDQKSSRNERITQHVEMIKEAGKARKLVEVVRRSTPPFIVFVNLKLQCQVVSRALFDADISNAVLHGGKSQQQRESALEGFKAGEFDVLVATDVAGRGLDIPGVEHVINYDAPLNIERYTHRIGRTGRAGKSGVATTFLTNDDGDLYYDLRKYLESTNQEVPPDLARHPRAQVPNGEVELSKRDRIQLGMM